jgi:predicted phosphoribosyltransferase
MDLCTGIDTLRCSLARNLAQFARGKVYSARPNETMAGAPGDNDREGVLVSNHFADRAEAGRLLGQRLQQYANRADTLILALPRGGVAVGFELAAALGVPMDILGVRKLGVPQHEELAFGAIAGGGVQILDPEVTQAFSLSPETIDAVTAAEKSELDRREALFRSGRAALAVRDRTVILVDDGIATGSTMLAAIDAVSRLGARRVVVAAGVAPRTTAQELSARADEVVCLFTPRDFRAVSLFYDSFPQLTDEDVRDLLDRASRRHAPRD